MRRPLLDQFRLSEIKCCDRGRESYIYSLSLDGPFIFKSTCQKTVNSPRAAIPHEEINFRIMGKLDDFES